MRFTRVVFAAAVVLAAWAAPDPAEAGSRSHFSFGYYGPGVSLHVGRYPYYRPYYYRPYYYRPYYYRTYRYRAPRYRRPARSRCSYWHRRCVRNWGHRNRNYYGCMRHHRCR